MAKAILIIDIPQNCFACKLQNYANCKVVEGCHVGNNRPDWCPLQELPEKNPNNPELAPGTYYREDVYEVYKKGWNDLYDKLVNQASNRT